MVVAFWVHFQIGKEHVHEVRAYMEVNKGAQIKQAHAEWMKSAERAAFIAGRKGVQF